MARKQTARAMAGDDSRRIISANAFNILIRNLKTAEADKNSGVSAMGGFVTDAVQKHNVNKKALSWFRAADRMSGAKLRDLLEQFEHYCNIGGLNRRAQEQEEMYSAEERGTVEPAPTPTFAEKVRKARNGNGPVQRKPRRTRQPTPAEVTAIADRAEGDELH